MKTTFLRLFVLLCLSALASPASAGVGAALHIGSSGPPTADIGFFYDELAPYGHWVETPRYGWAWAPTVEPDWRPYADGRWLHTDSGWTWLSDEPFGWATYHYGRWDLDPAYGWMWIPGDEWGPAWVDWRADDDYIGWAPLPPRYEVRPRFALWRADVGLPPESYLFVPEPQFLEPRVVAFALPPGQARKLFRRTRNFTRYRIGNGLIINEGVPVARIQRRIGRRVPLFQVSEMGPREWRGRARFRGNQVAMFRPRIQRIGVAVPPARRIAHRAVMTPVAAAEVRRVARASRAAMGLGPPQMADLPRPDRGRIVRGHELRKLRARQGIVRPPEKRQGRNAEVRRLGKPQREVKQNRGRPEVHRSLRSAPGPERKMRQRHSDRSGRRFSPGSRSHPQRQSFRQPDRGQRGQRAVRQDRHGGGRRGAMRGNHGGGRQGRRGGGRGH